jgi:hypothetical protein
MAAPHSHEHEIEGRLSPIVENLPQRGTWRIAKKARLTMLNFAGRQIYKDQWSTDLAL